MSGTDVPLITGAGDAPGPAIGRLVGREVAARMLERGTGSLLFTGATASVRGGAGFSAFAGRPDDGVVQPGQLTEIYRQPHVQPGRPGRMSDLTRSSARVGQGSPRPDVALTTRVEGSHKQENWIA